MLDKGGLLVLPSGPGLSTINQNIQYHNSLKNADIALFDRGYLCILLKILKGSTNLLKKIKYIIVEVSDNEIYTNQPIANEIIKHLYNKNFTILKENLPTKINNSSFVQRDILFKNQLID